MARVEPRPGAPSAANLRSLAQKDGAGRLPVRAQRATNDSMNCLVGAAPHASKQCMDDKHAALVRVYNTQLASGDTSVQNWCFTVFYLVYIFHVFYYRTRYSSTTVAPLLLLYDDVLLVLLSTAAATAATSATSATAAATITIGYYCCCLYKLSYYNSSTI